MKKTAAYTLSAFLLATAAALSAPTWETGNYDPDTWAPRENNVIAGVVATDGLSYYNEGGKNMTQNPANLTDGVVPGANMDYTKVTGISGGTLTWELANPVNLTGFRIFTRWGDGGRDGIYTRSLSVKYAGDSEYTVLDAVPRADVGRGDNNTSSHLYASLTDPDGAIAENITGIQLTFSSSQDNNGTGYVEIEALGVPVAAAWHTISVSGISAWRATVSGSIGSCAGGTSSDVYFAYGTDASALVPALVAEDVAEGDTFTLPQLTGLAAGTTYAYASYSVSDTGVQSSLVSGTFTTAAAVPVEASATLKYAGTSKAALEGVVSNLGEEGASATFYFAMGADAATLAPTAYTNGLTAGASFEIPFTGLEPATTYAFACYAVNDLGAQSATYTGTFTTTDGSAPRWLGLVSENWSDGLNWDTETAPAANSTVARIILDYPYGCHPPANLDIPGLAITRLRIVSDRAYSYTMDGQSFTCWGIEGQGSAAGDVTILNDIVIRNGGYNQFAVGLQRSQTVRLLGSLSSPDTGLTVNTIEYCGNLYLGGTNTFSGKIFSHNGALHFDSDAALGSIPDTLPDSPTINSDYGTLRFAPKADRNLNVISLAPTRYLAGDCFVHNGVEACLPTPIGDGFRISGADGERVKFAVLDGGIQDGSTIRVNMRGLIVRLGDNCTLPAARGFYAGGGIVDFNGHDSGGSLENWEQSLQGNPCFLNSNRDEESVLSGDFRLGHCEGAFLGGAGDIRFEGNFTQNQTQSLRKNGSGRLTLAGESAGWTGGTSFTGDTTLDYSTYNTPKLGNTSVHMAYGNLHIVANGSESTVCEMSKLTLDGGLTTLSTESGAGLTLSPSSISNLNRDNAIDFQLDAGTSLAFTDASFVNNAQFGGLNAGATWNHGSTFAYLNGDGSVGPLPASLLDTVYESGTIWSVPSGATSLPGGTPVGIHIAAPDGPATITLAGTVDIQTDGNAGPVLVSSSCAGDVTITGGTLKPQNYNRGTVVHNWNTNGVLRISSNLPETNDNNFMVSGPGTTVIDNDGNGFYYGPHTFGGGTLRFTSIADSGTASALGKGRNGDGQINLGHGVTFEYAGTAPEGHSSNRRLALYGDVTLKASGEGPLVLDNGTAIASGISGARAILDGEGEGRIDGAIGLGVFGSVVKRGSGTWTLASDASSYEYPTEVEVGVLRVTGALPGTAIVHENGTLAFGEGAVVKRHLETSGTIRYEADSDAAVHAPVRVWGKATLSGVLDVQGRLAEPAVVLVAENGIEGSFSSASNKLQVKVVGNTVVANPSLPTVILFQ